MQYLRRFFDTTALLLTGTLILGHAGPASSATPADSEAAVREAVQRYVAAWNKGDIKAMAACWSPDGEFVDPTGTVTKADDLLSQKSQQLSENQRPKLTVKATTRFGFRLRGSPWSTESPSCAHASPAVIDHARFSSL